MKNNSKLKISLLLVSITFLIAMVAGFNMIGKSYSVSFGQNFTASSPSISDLPVLQYGVPDTRGGMVLDDKYVWISDHKSGLWRVDRCTATNPGDKTSNDSASWDLWWYDPLGNYPQNPDGVDTGGIGYYIYEIGANGSVYVINSAAPATAVKTVATGGGVGYGIYAAAAPQPRLFVATTGGIYIYDISNPVNPVFISKVLPGLDFVGVRGAPGYNYVLANSFTDNKTYIIDIGTGAVVSSVSYGMTGAIRRGYLYETPDGDFNYYVVNNMGDMWIVDVNNPASPSIISAWNSPAGGLANMPGGSVYVYQGYAFALTSSGNDKGYLYMLDIRNPANPILQDTMYDAAFGFNDIRIQGCEIHIAAHDGWKMYTIQGWKPDLWLSSMNTTNWVGDDIYEWQYTSSSIQQKTQYVVPNETATFYIKVQNDTDREDIIKLISETPTGPGWTVQYFVDDTDITSFVKSGGFTTEFMNTGDSFTIRLEITPDFTVPGGSEWFEEFAAESWMCFDGSCTASQDKDWVKVVLSRPQMTVSKDDGVTSVIPGDILEYDIVYSNTGSTATDIVITDVLPVGMTFVSAQPAPFSVSGQTVTWHLASLAGTGISYTIQLVARVSPDAAPNSSLTNNVAVDYEDTNGNSYPQESDDDTDTTGQLPLAKTVDKALANAGDVLTYGLYPHYDFDSALNNVRVIDTIPPDTTYVTGSATAGGIYGAYIPLAGVPGSDIDTGLSTSMSVSTNFVNPGGSVTVTLNAFKTGAPSVADVSPTALNVTGGAYEIVSGPTPASGTVPNGGTGLDFVWVIRPLETGEYAFSAGATDLTEVYDWPAAKSATVLSSAGGPNTVTWNLGSTTAAADGLQIISGATSGIYAFPGNDSTNFLRFDLLGNSWAASATTIGTIKEGGSLAYDGLGYTNGYIYALRGDGTRVFGRYDIDANSWATLGQTPANIKQGGSLVYLNGNLYALRGDGQKNFYRYNVAGATWTAMDSTTDNVRAGGALTTDGTNIYALRGDGKTTFWRYNVAANTWTAMAPTPANVKNGGALTYLNGYIYAFGGDNKTNFWRYDIAANTWSAMAATPATVGAGGALTTDGTYIYGLRGNTTNNYWRYDPVANTWTALQPVTQNVVWGGALAYVYSGSSQTRTTHMSAHSGLLSTGDTVTVSLDVASSTAVNNVVPGAVTVTATGGATATLVSGPTPASQNISAGGTVTYTWVYSVTAGSTTGSLKFSATPTGDGPVTFATATSNSILVIPVLTYQATVNSGAVSPILNTGLMVENNILSSGLESNEVRTDLGATVGDFIWYDENHDGVQDLTESGFAGVTVNLLDGSSTVIQTAVTDANGYYHFSNVAAGTYTVQVVTSTLPAYYAQTYDIDAVLDNTCTVVVSAATDYLYADFGYDDAGEIGDLVYADDNGDGTWDTGEAGIPNIGVALYEDTNNNNLVDAGDMLLATTSTDASGNYLFSGLPAGNYIVVVDESDPQLPAGYSLTTSQEHAVDLTPGQSYQDADFGFTNFGSIGDMLFEDSNHNGVFDLTDARLGGVQVILTDANNNTYYTNTSSDGSYTFYGLAAGTYTVAVNPATLPDGLEQVFDPDSTLDGECTVTLGIGEDYRDADFGYDGNSSIGDTVWRDLNGDGAQSGLGETGISGVTVNLYKDFNGNGVYDSGETLVASAETDANGNYTFEGLKAGQYVVVVDTADTDIPVDYTNTTPTNKGVALASSEDYVLADFGFGPFGQIGDTVFNDSDANGTQDLGELGIAGVTVNLKDSLGNIIDTAVTDANGNYLFMNVIPGDYTVEVAGPAGMDITTPGSYSVTLAAGEYYLDADFGFNGKYSIGDRIWYDTNGDGVQDAGETAGIPDVIVYLFEDENLNGYNDDGEKFIGTATTDANGNYLFEYLSAGQYLVVLDPFVANIPAGYAATTPTTHIADLTALPPGDYLYEEADFGFSNGFSAVGDTVWFDKDGNGLQDTGTTDEPGIAGVDVVLYKNDGSGNYVEVARDTTDEYGHYFIGELTPGDYRVMLDPATIPVGLAVTTAYPIDVTFTTPRYYSRADFGLRGDSSIGDFVWYDANGDGLQTGEETNGLPNITVQLWQDSNNNGILDLGIGGDWMLLTDVTDANGNYLFENLSTGTYFVAPLLTDPDLPAGYTPTTDSVLTKEIAVAGTHMTDADFGFGQFTMIGDRVWRDTNANGVQNTGEPGIPGITVILTPPAGIDLGNGAGQPVTTVTDDAGNYYFQGIPVNSGTYQVAVDMSTVPAGYGPTLPNVGNDATDSDSINGDPVEVTVSTGYNNTIDFGYLHIRTDPAVTKTHTQTEPYGTGDEVTFTIGVENRGDNTATGVTVTDTLPAGMTYISISPAVGVVVTNNPDGTTTLVWSAGTVNIGAVKLYYVTASVDSYTEYYLTNTVSVTSNEFDVNLGNNTATDDILLGHPAFTILKEVWDGNAWQDANTPTGPEGIGGEPMDFRISVTNTGNVTLTNMTFEDLLTGEGMDETPVTITPIASIAIGATVRIEFSQEIFNGQNLNTITASVDYHGETITHSEIAYAFGKAAEPGVDIQKYVSFNEGVTWFDADTAPGPQYDPSTAINPQFKFVVTNTGNVTLTDLSVDDNVFGNIDTLSTLAPDEVWESSIITQFYDFGDLEQTGPIDWLNNLNVSVIQAGMPELWDFNAFSDNPHNEGSWIIGTNFWTTGHWYYLGVIQPGESVHLPLQVNLDEDLTTNEYMGATFYLQPKFEAIQTKNEAVYDEWGMGYLPGINKWLPTDYDNTDQRWEATDADVLPAVSYFWDMLQKLWQLIV